MSIYKLNLEKIKDVSREFDEFRSILIFASCVDGTCNILYG